MPLAVDTEVFRINNDAEKYQTDISLVGKMYQTEYTYFTAPLSEYMRGYLEGIVNSQMKLYGGYMIPDLITETLLERMNQEYQKLRQMVFRWDAENWNLCWHVRQQAGNGILHLHCFLAIFMWTCIPRIKTGDWKSTLSWICGLLPADAAGVFTEPY